MRCSTGTWTPGYPLTALWINNPTFDTDHRHRHRHRGGMLTKTPPPTELQIPATVTTLILNTHAVNGRGYTVPGTHWNALRYCFQLVPGIYVCPQHLLFWYHLLQKNGHLPSIREKFVTFL